MTPQDICNAAKLYADLVHTKLTEKGYYDDEGQFDVTEEVFLLLSPANIVFFSSTFLHIITESDLIM